MLSEFNKTRRRGRLCAHGRVCLFALGLLVAWTGLAGCGPGHHGTETIRFWNGFTGPDGRHMLGMVKRFNEGPGRARVLMQRTDWGTYYNKLFVAGLGGRAPEVFVIHTSNLERFAQANFIEPLDELLARPGELNPADFPPNILDAVRRNGHIMGLPLDVHMLGMYTNRRLLRQAGCVDARGEALLPRDRREFMTALERISKLEASGQHPWGFVYTWFRTNMYTLMCQWGGEMFTPDQSRCTLNAPENVAALEFATSLIRQYHFAPAPENFDSWIGFRQGRVGIAFEGIYMLEDLRKQTDLDYDGAPLPLLGRQRATWADSHVLCLRRGLSSERRQAAWEFVRYLSDHSLEWAAAGQVPARLSLQRSPEFQKMRIQRAFAEQISYVRYAPRVPFILEFQTEFDAAVERALRGSQTPKQALDQATRRIDQVIRRYAQAGRS